MLIGTLAFAPSEGIIAVAASCAIGGALQLTTLWLSARRPISDERPVSCTHSVAAIAHPHGGVKHLATAIFLSTPLPLIPVFERYGVAMSGSFTSVAILAISWSIVSGFWGLLIRGTSLASVFYKQTAPLDANEPDELSALLIQYVVVVLLPVALLLAERAIPILQLSFQYGKVKPGDVAVLGRVLNVHLITICVLAAYTLISRRLFLTRRYESLFATAVSIPVLLLVALAFTKFSGAAVSPVYITPFALALPLLLTFRRAIATHLFTVRMCLAALALGLVVTLTEFGLLHQTRRLLESHGASTEVAFALLATGVVSSAFWLIGNRYRLSQTVGGNKEGRMQ
jgi:peptidoglycan biosynthesis protein MviN/MurJ (putative lipid II flippase)